MAEVAADAEANAAAAAPPSSEARHSSSAWRLGLSLRAYKKPRGYEPSGSRSNVVDGWIAGVTAPVAGSTCKPAWIATVSIRISATSPDPLSFRIVQRLAAHRGRHRVAEHVDRQPRSRRGRGDRDVAVGDRRADRVAVAAARHAPDRAALAENRLAADHDRGRIGQGQTDQLLHEPLGLLAHARLAADEVALV